MIFSLIPKLVTEEVELTIKTNLAISNNSVYISQSNNTKLSKFSPSNKSINLLVIFNFAI